jgi:peptide/nickel transport system substrate-binding protein
VPRSGDSGRAVVAGRDIRCKGRLAHRGKRRIMRRLVSAMMCLAAVFCAPRASATDALHPWTQPDVLRYGDQVEPDSLNPYLANALAASRVDILIFSGLLRYGRNGALLPDLATAVPTAQNGGISRDGRTITYHLNKNALWHDGVPVTAADVVFTWHAIMDPRNNVTSRNGYDQIASVVAVDPHTVRISYREPYAPALNNFAAGLSRKSILPKHILEHADFNTADFNRAPIGSGPYAFVRWDHGSEIVLAAYPKFFRGKAIIPRIDYRVIPDTNTLFNLVRTHEIDAAEIEASFVAAAKQSPGVDVVEAATLGYRHIDYNTTHPGLDERDVRLALSYAIDRDAIYKKIYYGIGERTPGDQLVSFGWGDPRLPRYPYDPTKAEAMLDRAGWRRGSDGIRAKNGRRLSLVMRAIAGQKPAEALEVELQADWQKIGVELTIKNSPGTTLFANGIGPLTTGDYDVAYYGFEREADPDDTETIGPSAVPPNGRNWSRYRNPEVGRLQHLAIVTLDRTKRRAIYDRIERILVADDPFDTIYWIPSIIGYNVDVRGLDPTPGTVIFWNANELRFAGAPLTH